jgi:hypothetical protein
MMKEIKIRPEIAEKLQQLAANSGIPIDSVADALLERALADRGTLTTGQVCERLGVSRRTVRRNWKTWGLRRIGQSGHGEFVFTAASVAAHLAR